MDVFSFKILIRSEIYIAYVKIFADNIFQIYTTG